MTVSWSPPSTAGSFPISNYQVQASPHGGCVVPAATTNCEITGLRNGQTYEVRVRSLTGAGWGSWSDPVTVVPEPPAPERSILITGSRSNNDRVVRVQGQTTGLIGATVQAMVATSGQDVTTAGSTRVVNSEGKFTWQRRGSVSFEVYFTSGDLSSNTITIPARD